MDHIVDFMVGDVVKVHSRQIEQFKRIAVSNSVKKRYRMCLHESPENSIHDMFLCRTKGDYYRPDKHYGIPESHTIIEGKEAVILFSDNGDIIDWFILDRESDFLSYRINADIYHMTIALTETAIDYEVKPGPFKPEMNIFPNWAPDGKDRELAIAFMDKILNNIMQL